jgi:hypothetical protein
MSEASVAGQKQLSHKIMNPTQFHRSQNSERLKIGEKTTIIILLTGTGCCYNKFVWLEEVENRANVSYSTDPNRPGQRCLVPLKSGSTQWEVTSGVSNTTARNTVLIHNMIYILNRNWVDTQWQQYSTHLQTIHRIHRTEHT